MFYKLLVICVLATSICESYNILVVAPMPFTSHSILGESILNALLTAGHQVTYITPFAPSYSHLNLSHIVIQGYKFKGLNFKSTYRSIKSFKNVFDSMLNVSYSMLTDPNVQRLLEDTAQSFDLVIAEWMYNELYSGFSAVFNCPYLWLFTLHNDQFIMKLTHESPNPGLTANIRTDNVPPLNFLERTTELLYALISETWKYLHYDPLELKMYDEIYRSVLDKRGRILPPYEEVRYNASLTFVNSQPTIRDNLITPQSYKSIGGFHISETTEPLSQELLNIIEGSNKNVVLFSFGSFLKPEELSSSIKRDLLTMFSELNHTVLWKINEQFHDLPSNVRTFPWIPIKSILAHPKCVLFITHGGILSLTESVHYGVPVVGVPVFGDQTVNIKTIVKRGVARMVTMGPMLADALKEAIEDVLNDPRYQENMKALSSLYHDRPLSPRSELLYWVEHVVSTGGAPHLRSPALLVPWYQKYYIDLAAVLLVFLIGFMFILNKLFVFLIDNVKVMFDRNYWTVLSKKKI